MNDRELLKLAAKAAGNPQGTSFSGDGLLMENDLYWSPLTNDGDAFRLAVKLRQNCGFAFASNAHPDWSYGYCGSTQEPFGGDENSTLRRAIVSAAAEVGKGVSDVST